MGSHAHRTWLPVVQLLLRFLQVTLKACRHKSRFSLKPFWQRSRHCSTPAAFVATRKHSTENIPWPVLPSKRHKEHSFSISSRLNLEISDARTTSKALQAQAQHLCGEVVLVPFCIFSYCQKESPLLALQCPCKTTHSSLLRLKEGSNSVPGLEFLLFSKPSQPFLACTHLTMESQWQWPFYLG